MIWRHLIRHGANEAYNIRTWLAKELLKTLDRRVSFLVKLKVSSTTVKMRQAHEAPFYVVEYTDGDHEDYNDKELEYASELALQISLDDEDNMAISDTHTTSGEEESYRPPKVCCQKCSQSYIAALILILSPNFRNNLEQRKSVLFQRRLLLPKNKKTLSLNRLIAGVTRTWRRYLCLSFMKRY
jgi:hypothetical protein